MEREPNPNAWKSTCQPTSTNAFQCYIVGHQICFSYSLNSRKSTNSKKVVTIKSVALLPVFSEGAENVKQHFCFCQLDFTTKVGVNSDGYISFFDNSPFTTNCAFMKRSSDFDQKKVEKGILENFRTVSQLVSCSAH